MAVARVVSRTRRRSHLPERVPGAMAIVLMASVFLSVPPAVAAPVDAKGRPKIEKLGTVAAHVVETSPIVLGGRLYRFQWMRGNNPDNPFRNRDNKQQRDHYVFVDVATGKMTEPFADGYRFGSAFVRDDTVYVSATGSEGGWFGRHVEMFVSEDLKNWTSYRALDDPKYGICNTSIAKAGDKYVMMFEILEPRDQAGVKFTARFATSSDLKKWEFTPPECVYAKDRYSAPHCLRYLDGWYYDFYLEAHQGYETRVVRSRNLVHWEPSPLNPVLRNSPDDKKIASAKLSEKDRADVAKAKNLNNSDIDFCEFGGKLVIYYSWGDQQGTEFLARARYDGTEEEFLRGWFPTDKSPSR